MKFYKENKLYIFIVAGALILGMIGLYLEHMETLNKVTETVTSYELFWKYVGFIFIFLSKITLISVVVKFLLAMKPFKESIYNIFKEIFIDKNIIEQYNHNELRKLANKISLVDSKIKFNDLENEELSMKSLEESWKNNSGTKNYIVKESYFDTTIYTTGQTILTRRYNCKVMKTGKFNLKHYFIPFDENIDFDLYKNDKELNRWDNKSFKFIVRGLESQDHQIKAIFSNETLENEDWILISFECDRIEQGKEFDLEFSISDKIDTESSQENLDKLSDYFDSKYNKPHGIRHIKFQIETYNDKINNLNLVPILNIGDNDISKESIKSIYYTSWVWDIHFSQYKDETIKLNISN